MSRFKKADKGNYTKDFLNVIFEIIFKRTQNGITSGFVLMLRSNIVHRIGDSNPKYHRNIYKLVMFRGKLTIFDCQDVFQRLQTGKLIYYSW